MPDVKCVYRVLGAGVLVALAARAIGAQQVDSARLLRNGEDGILSVFGFRPVDLAAEKVADEFGVGINVEDPVHLYGEDVQLSHITPAGKRVLVPKPRLLETQVRLTRDGSLQDLETLVTSLADMANAQLPFRYRVDRDSGVFTLVPTATRDEQGHYVEATPLLDQRVTIPAGSRRISEHVQLLADALQHLTGIRVSCCQTGVAGVPWGNTVIPFEARDEPARTAFLRLVRSEPSQPQWERIPGTGQSRRIATEPGRYYWLMRCQPAESWCFINVRPIPDKRKE